VNGTPRIASTGSAGITTLSTAASPITLGCNPANMGCFSGMFDDLRVWNVARSAAEIMGNYTRLLAGNETGLVGYWKFDEAPGSASAADSVTTVGHNAHAGMLMATTAAELPTFVTPTPPAPIVCP